MRVSVVIPTYNRAGTILTAVESALAQGFRALEVVVVDDGSTDDTAERLAKVHDARLRCIRGRHAGVAAARNLGVREAGGELIAFLDSDDAWMPHKLEHEVAFLDAHPEADAVFSDLQKRDGHRVVPSFMRETSVFAGLIAGRARPDGILLGQREMFLCLLEEVPIKPSALVVRRAAFLEAGGFDETWSSSEDWEFLLRFARARRFGYVDRPLAMLTISPDSLHRVDQARGEHAMIRLLAHEHRRLRRDIAARSAARRGLVTRVKHLGWHHGDAGRWRDAARVYLRGFGLTGDLGLLARALVSLATASPSARAA